ncbi:peptidoglycan -binding protein [Falsiroseomonas sp. HC035]|uniref:peptidoglycan -binding protein n=1 Tax=Falsiroseomonas sp. HC035 TaxID=3390999 RepID=UPI003D315166
MALGGRRRRGGGGLDAWPGYVDALSTLLMVIIFVLLVFVLGQGFLSVALSSRDRALDRLNRQVSELSELLSLERGQAEELRGSLGRLTEDLRVAVAARDVALEGASALREERDRLVGERDAARGERSRLSARLADLELSARDGSARIAELEGRLAEAQARAEAAGGDTARTVRTLTDAQRLLAAERAALEAVRRDLATVRGTVETLGRDLAGERSAREATAQDLAVQQREAQALARDLAAERTVRGATEAELAEARALSARELAARRQEAEGLARELAAARAVLEAAQRDAAEAQGSAQALSRDLAAERAARQATAQELAQARATAARDLEERRREAAALAAELAQARAGLEAARRDLAALRAEAERLDQTVTADRATIQGRLSDIASLTQQISALQALRDQVERQAQQALAQAEGEARQRTSVEQARDEALALLRTEQARVAQAEQGRTAAAQLASEANRRAAEEERRRAAAEAQAGEFGRLSESARAQVALLTRQLEALRAEMSRVAGALDAAEDAGRDKEAQIVALGQRLNVALAARVEELQQYRSDFFGRLRRVLGERPEVRIVGDRFVFQSEVLFPVGSAEMSPAGQQQMRELGTVLLELSRQFPADLGWLLRVDGHADRSPIRGGGRNANWELSAARALAVARLLIDAGLPANRVAAAAFGDTQPLDDRDTPDALARNRRIELRLEPAPTGSLPQRAAAPAAPDLRRVLAEVAQGQACARLAVTGDDPPRLTGVARRAAEPALRGALQARGAPAEALAVSGFEGPYCEVLAVLRQAPMEGGLGLVGSGPQPDGAALRFDVAMPGWGGQLALYYLSTSGEAVRLDQRTGLPAGARLRLGEAGSGPWLVEAPFGTDMVLALASEGPLLAASQSQVQPVADFAAALASAMEAARREGRRVAARAIVVQTVPR